MKGSIIDDRPSYSLWWHTKNSIIHRSRWQAKKKLMEALVANGFDVKQVGNPWRLYATKDDAEFCMDFMDFGEYISVDTMKYVLESQTEGRWVMYRPTTGENAGLMGVWYEDSPNFPEFMSILHKQYPNAKIQHFPDSRNQVPLKKADITIGSLISIDVNAVTEQQAEERKKST